MLDCAMLFKFLKNPTFHETGLISLSFIRKIRKMLHRSYPPARELLLDGVTFGEFQNISHSGVKSSEILCVIFHASFLELLLPPICFQQHFTFLIEAEGRFFISTGRYDTFLGF